MEKSKNQNKKIRFIVVREFSGEKPMGEAFEQAIERQACERFEDWRGRPGKPGRKLRKNG